MGKKKEAAKAAAKAAKKAAKQVKPEPTAGSFTPAPLVDPHHAGRMAALAAEVEADREKRHGKKKAKPEPVLVEQVQAEATPDGITVTGVLTEAGGELHAIAAALDPAPPAELAVATVAPEVERDQWGRPYVTQADGSRKGYRRVTTYIDVLEDKTALEKYGKRTVLAGVALDYDTAVRSVEQPSIVRRALDVITATDAELAQLEGNDLASVNREAALKAQKDALDGLAEEAYDVAGGHAKAQKGTDLHALTELVDQGLPLPADLSDADRRDLEAYSATVKALGITFTDRERFVVNDELETGGTLDRAGLYRSASQGWQRARRVVMDIKTGRLDYSAGKIGMQLATYARSDAYDHATGERTPLKLDKKLGLLIHLPAGQGTCQVYEVDLELAYRGLLLAREVYAWRRDGKKVYDLKAPLQAVTA